MKVFVDTSVWISYLSGHKTKSAVHLARLLDTGNQIYSLPIIIQEVLQGILNDKDFGLIHDKLEATQILPFEFDAAAEAARLYRTLRKKGLTINTVDVQIASTCIVHGIHLLTEDKGFSLIAKNSALKLFKIEVKN